MSSFSDDDPLDSLKLSYVRLVQEKQLVDMLVGQLRAGAVLTDPRGRILLMNKGAKNLLGGEVDTGDRIQSTLKTFKISPTLERIFEKPGRKIRAHASRTQPDFFHLAIEITKLGGEGAAGIDVTPGWVWLLYDVTKQETDERLHRDFLSLISHKMRTPLTPMLGYCELLQRSLDQEGLGERFSTPLRKIRSEGEKVHALVEQLLDFVSLSQSQLIHTGEESIDLCRTVRDSVENLDPELAAKVSSCEIFAEGSVMVAADPLSVFKIVRELVDNAIKFNDNPDKNVEISVTTGKGRALLSVKDNGPGIPEEEWDRVFQKFYQIDSDFTGQVSGWGLGLSLVRSIVELWKGEVLLDSDAGKGTEVRISLPIKT